MVEEDVLTWEEPKLQEEVKRTKPRASVSIILEVFTYTKPNVELEDTGDDEESGDEKLKT